MSRNLTWRSFVVLIAISAGLGLAPAIAQRYAYHELNWSSSTLHPYGTHEAQGIAVGGKLYVFGGFDTTRGCCYPTARAYALDPARDTWTAIRPLPASTGTTFAGFSHAGATTDGAAIYLAGGYTFNAAGSRQAFATKDVWRYDIAANTYSRLKDLPAARGAGRLELLDGMLHFFGGSNAARADSPDHYVLDLANSAAGWLTKAPLPNPRNHLGSAVLGGKMYAVGGGHGHDSAVVTQSTVEAYDPATDTWSPRASLPKAIDHISATTFTHDGRIIVLGGETSYGKRIADASAYDPVTNAWSALTSLPASRSSGVAGVIGDQLFFATGSFSRYTFRGVPVTPGTGFSRSVNFQPSSSVVPPGYVRDSGLAFDAGRGSGWVTQASLSSASHVPMDVSAYARERNAVSDQRLDTLMHMQHPSSGTPAAWELVVANGSYTVTLSVGDPSALDSTHSIQIEGDVAISGFVPTSTTRFAQATRTVTVSDGRLTIDAIGGTNTKINYVDVSAALP